MFPSGWSRLWNRVLRRARRVQRVGEYLRPSRPLAEHLEERLAPATFLWDGGGPDSNWSTPQNWVGDIAPSRTGTVVGPTIVYDDLVFPPGVANLNPTNDFMSATFNSIAFSGSGYTLISAGGPGFNSITLGDNTSGSGYITANLGAMNNRINIDIQMGGSADNRQFFTVGTIGASLDINGQISGTTGVTITKQGPGVLIFSADNSGFTGPITIAEGALRVTNALALGSTTADTTVGTNAQLQVQNVAGAINERLLLNGPGLRNDGALLATAGTGNTWAGAVRLDSDSTVGALTSSTLTITGQVSDLGAGHNLTKESQGRVVLDPLGIASGNIYRGITYVNDGTLTIRHSLGLGAGGSAANATIVNAGLDRRGTLQLESTNNPARIDPNRTPTNDGFIVSTELLTINGPGFGNGALNNLSGNNVWTNSVTIGSITPLGSNATIGVEANWNLTIDGVVQDPSLASAFTLTKSRPGRLIFTNNNTYKGATIVAGGALNIRDSRGLGPAFSSTTTVNDGAALELQVDTKPDSVSPFDTRRLNVTEILRIAGVGLGRTGALHSISGVNTWTGTITLDNISTVVGIGVDRDPSPIPNETYYTDEYSLRINTPIQGVEGTILAKVVTGHLIFSTNNDYLGQTRIESGWVTIENEDALGGRIIIPRILSDRVQPFTSILTGAALHLRATTPTGSLRLRENFVVRGGNGISHPYAALNQKGAILNIQGNNFIGGTTHNGGSITLGGQVGIGAELVFPSVANAFSELTLQGSLNESPPAFGLTRDAAGGELEDRVAIDTGATAGTIFVTYDFFTIPDQLRVYYEGVRIFDTGIVGTPGGPVTVAIPYGPGIDTIVELVMNEGNGQPGTAWTYSVNIVPTKIGPGGINKLGTKRVYIQGEGSYRGDVDIIEGVLRIQNDTALGVDTGSKTTVRNGAALEISRSLALLNGGISTGVQVWKGEQLVLGGLGNDTNGAHISTVTVLNDDNMWRGPTTLTSDVEINIAADSRFNLFGPMDDTSVAGFVKLGTGKLSLAGASTFRGNVNVSSGVLNVQNGRALGQIPSPGSTVGGTTVQAGASLELQGDISVSGEPLTLLGGPGATAPAVTPRWFPQGPAPILMGQTNGRENVTGRVTGIVSDPTDPNTVYITAADGGAWKTNDGGQTWLPLLDSFATNTPIFAGAIAMDANDPRILYVGLGEANWFTRNLISNGVNGVFYGQGVLRSTNSGRSWTMLTGAGGFSPVLGKAISRVVADGNNIYVATSDLVTNGTVATNGIPVGVWRFNIPTSTWFCLTNVVSTFRSVPQNNDTPPNTPGPDDEWRLTFPQINASYTDLMIGGGALFVAIGTPGGARVNGVYRCPNPTSNAPTWALGDGMRNSGGGSGFPTGADPNNTTRRSGNIKTSISFGLNPLGIAYAIVEDTTTPLSHEVYRSIGTATSPVGVVWELASSLATGSAMDISPSFYALTIAADPLNAAIIVMGGVGQPFTGGPLRSTDRGSTFTELGNAIPAPHVDYHASAFDNFGRAFVGTDGGVWRLDSVAPITWRNYNGNLAISQFIGIALHPTDPEIAYGGTQDNGTMMFNGAQGWRHIADGDGGFVAVDPIQPQFVYHTFQGVSLERSNNGGATFTPVNPPLGSSMFYMPYALDPINPSRLVAGGSIVGNIINESVNQGTIWSNLVGLGGTVTAIGLAGLQGQITASATNTVADDPSFTHVLDRGADTYDPDTIYYTTLGGDVVVTKDHGRRWVNRSPAGGSPISDIAVDPLRRDVAYISRNVFGVPKVFATTNAGQTWTNITANLPDTPVWTIQLDPRTGDLFVGTDIGVYRRVGGTTNWVKYGGGLPDVQGRDLALNTTLSTLGLGTHGRSMFQAWLEGPAIQPGDQFGTMRSISGTVVWTGDITIQGDLFIRAESSSQLTLVGSIRSNSDANEVIKIGPGKAVLAGSNEYGGLTEVREGTLATRNDRALGKPTAPTIVNQFGLGAALELQANLLDEPVQLYGTGFTLNGHETGALRNVSNFNTFTGPISLMTDNVTIGVDSGSQLIHTGVISDGTATPQELRKELTGTLILAGANTYNRITYSNQGALGVQNALALGTAARGTRVRDGAQLQMLGNVTVTSESLELTGTGIFGTGAMQNVNGINTWQGPITMTRNWPGQNPTTVPPNEISFGSLAGRLNIDVTLVQTSPLAVNKVGVGTVAFLRQNNYTGVTTVAGGTLTILHPLALGSTSNGTVVIAGATLGMENVGTVTAEALTLNGDGVGGNGALRGVLGSNTWNSLISLQSSSRIGVDAGSILTADNGGGNSITGAASSSLTKVGQGTLVLPTTNDYAGATFVNNGVLSVLTAQSLGTTVNGTTVNSGGTLRLQGSFTHVGETLSINGQGFSNQGALQGVGTPTWQANITLAGNSSFGALNSSDTLTVVGIVGTGGAQTMNKYGAGTVILTGTTANAFSGLTQVNDGTLRLNKPADRLAIGGSVVVGDGVGAPSSARLVWDNPGQMLNGVSATVNGDGLLDLNNQQQRLLNLTITDGTVSTGSGAAAVLTVTNFVMTGGRLSVNGAGSQFDLRGDLVTHIGPITGAPVLDGAGTFIVFNGSRNFNVSDDGTSAIDLLVSVMMSGLGSLVKMGNGQARITSNNNYAGITTINSGSLFVDGIIGDTVVAGGLLGGNGSVGTLRYSNGTLSPGIGGPGRLTTVTSTPVPPSALSPLTDFVVELNGTNSGVNTDQLAVVGDIDLNGANLVGILGYNSQIGDRYTLVTATGQITGTFLQGTQFFLGDKKFLLTYNPQSVVLERVKTIAQMTLTSSANPSVYGQPILYSVALVSETGMGVPTGNVTFTLDGAPLVLPVGATGVVTFDPAVFLGMPLPVGTHTLVADYSGDAIFAANSRNLIQDVNKGNTVLTYTPSQPATVIGQPLTITITLGARAPAVGLPTGTVTLLVDGVPQAPMTLNAAGQASWTFNNLVVDLHRFDVAYSGDGNFNAFDYRAFTEYRYSVGKGSTTVTSVTANSSPSVYGELVTFTANIGLVAPALGTPTGTVTFFDGSALLGSAPVQPSGSATYTITAPLSTGTHLITVVYSGDNNFLGSNNTTSPLTQVVNKAGSATALSVNPNPSVFGNGLTLTALVSSLAPGLPQGRATGVVSFFVDGVFRGTNILDSANTARLNLPTLDAGSRIIRARYEGDTNYEASEVTITQVVQPAPTSVALTTSLANSVYGQAVTFRATVSSQVPGANRPNGTVTFMVDGNPVSPSVGVNASGIATFQTTLLTAGAHIVQARYDGDPNFAQSMSNNVAQTVAKANTSWTITPSVPSSAVFGQPVTYTIALNALIPGAGTPSGMVTVRLDGTDQAPLSLTSGRASFTPSGLNAATHRFNISYPGDTNFNGFSVTTFSDYFYRINKSDTVTGQVISSKPTATFGESLTFTTTISAKNPGAGTPTGTVTFFDGTVPLGTVNLDSFATATITPSSVLTGGNHVITARYNNDPNFNGSNSNATPLTQTISRAGTTTSLSTTPNPSLAGQVVTVTASLVGAPPSSAAGMPSGSVTFFVDGVNQGVAPIDGTGRAVFNLRNLTAGTKVITSTYNGDTNFAGSNGTTTQTVGKFGASVGITSSVAPSIFGQAVTFTATITPSVPGSGLPSGSATLFIDGIAASVATPLSPNGIATFTVNTLTGGARTIRVDYSGDVNFSTATGTITQTVNTLGTTTGLTVNPATASLNQLVTLQAQVNPVSTVSQIPTGNVVFRAGSVQLGSVSLDATGRATFTTSTLSPGTYTITASYSGDGNFSVSASSGSTLTITKASAAIGVITSSSPTSVFGQAIQVSTILTPVAPATVTPTGTVTFRDGTNVLGQATLDGTGRATLTVGNLPAGSRSLTATYEGDATYNSTNPSSPFFQQVNQAATSVTLSSLVNPSAFGQASVVATVTALAPSSATPTGTVTFSTGSLQIGPVSLNSQGQATLPADQLPPGTYTITASYSGTSNFQATTTTSSLSQTVNKVGTTTTAGTLTNPSVVGQGVTFTATVAPTSGTAIPTGSVTFTIDGVARTPAVNLDSTGKANLTVTNLSVGAHTVSISYSGDSRFSSSTSTTVAQTVNKADTRTTLSGPTTSVAFGASVTLTATLTVTAPGGGTPTGTVTFFDGANSLGTGTVSGGIATFTTTTLATGNRNLTARYDGDASYNGNTSSSFVLVVNKANALVTVATSRNVAVLNRNITLTANVTSASGGASGTGTVTFTSDGNPIGSATLVNGLATLVTNFTSLGNRLIRASFNGDANLNGGTGGPVTLLVGTLNQAWVSQAYLDLLGRQVDSGGLTYWTGLLNSGVPAAHVATLLQNSTEFRTIQVRSVYQQYLKRDADPAGLAFWVPYLQGGRTIAELRSQLIGSEEYFTRRADGTNPGFLNTMYLDVLGRPITDSDNRQQLLILLQQLTPRAAIALNTLRLPEASERLVNQAFQTYLRRSADPNGLVFWRNYLSSGGTEEALFAQLVGSPEYFARL